MCVALFSVPCGGEINFEIGHQIILLTLFAILQSSSETVDCRMACRKCHENAEPKTVLEVYCAMCEECKQRRREKLLARTSTQQTEMIRMPALSRSLPQMTEYDFTTGFSLPWTRKTYPTVNPHYEYLRQSMVSEASPLPQHQLPQQDHLDQSVQHPPAPQYQSMTQYQSMPPYQPMPQVQHLPEIQPMENPSTMPHRSGITFPSGCPTPPPCSDSEEYVQKLTHAPTTTTVQPTTCPPILGCIKKRKHQSCMPCMPICPCPSVSTPTTPTTENPYHLIYVGVPKNLLGNQS